MNTKNGYIGKLMLKNKGVYLAIVSFSDGTLSKVERNGVRTTGWSYGKQMCVGCEMT